MTIAFGILCSDGVVVAADSQVTVQGYWKGRSEKIWFSHHAGIGDDAGACFVSGATQRLEYLETLAQTLSATFLAHTSVSKKADMQQLLEADVAAFHLRHVAPYADLPQIDLVIGYQRDSRSVLWTTSRAAFSEHLDFGCVGIGGFAASTILRRFWRFGCFDVASAIALAVFVAQNVKETVDGCGAHTSVACLRNYQFITIDSSAISELEGAFRDYSEQNEPALLWQVLGVEPRDYQKPKQSTRALRSRVAKIVHAIRSGIQPNSPTTSSTDHT